MNEPHNGKQRMSEKAASETAEKTDPRLGSYRFDATSTLTHVDVEKGLSGGFQLVLHPSDQADAATLQKLPETLAGLKAYGAYSSVRDDKPVFVIPKVKDHAAFAASLQQAKLTTGAATYKEALNDTKAVTAVQKLLHFLQDHTLEAAGISGGVGYLALGVDGYVRGDKFLTYTGIAALCPLIVAIWGQGDKSGELTRLVGDVQNYLKDQGIEVPEQKFTAAQKHALSGLADFFKEHPVEISYALANIATAALWMQGLKEFREDGAWTKICTASTTLVGNAIVALFPEKHAKPVSEMNEYELRKRAARSPLEAVRDTIQESPLMVHGVLNVGDIVCWAKETLEDSFTGNRKVPGLNWTIGRDGKRHEFEAAQEELREKLRSLPKEKMDAAAEQEWGFLSRRQELDFADKANELSGKILDKQDSINYLTNKDSYLAGMSKADVSGVLKAIVATGLSLQIILGGISHKSKSEAEQIAAFDKVFAASANMLANMPEKQRDVVLEQTSAFLALHKSTGGLFTAEKVKEEITSRLNVLQKADWIGTTPPQETANNGVSFPPVTPEILVSALHPDGKVTSATQSPSLAG
jgi:hypothetical protein